MPAPASPWPALPAERSGDAEQIRESRRRSPLAVSYATSYLTIDEQLSDWLGFVTAQRAPSASPNLIG